MISLFWKRIKKELREDNERLETELKNEERFQLQLNEVIMRDQNMDPNHWMVIICKDMTK